MKYGCIGEHLSHSFSKEIHSVIGNYDYGIQELKPENLAGFLTEKDFSGINVTIPYKQAVIPYVDILSNEAKATGAVNTIINKNGTLFGYNTDVFGMEALIGRNRIEINGKKVLVIGTGGTAGTADYVAKKLGAEKIIFLSRNKKGSGIVNDNNIPNDIQIIINASPCGMFPDIFQSRLNIPDFKCLEGVVDAVYNPLCSKLVLDARQNGIKSCGGLYMLVAQAVKASSLFFEKEYSDSLTEKVYNNILLSKQNIVLIGMPGCGKTSVGKVLAKNVGRKFIDIDKIIETQYGTIGEIIKSRGESCFRELETQAVRSVSKLTGCIIACGGGTVLNSQNTNALRMNGKLIFLDRNIADITPDDSRPLSSTREKLNELYTKRLPVYEKSADIKLNVAKSIEETAKEAERVIFNENSCN